MYFYRVGLIANFRNGRQEGAAWQTLIGGGMLYGELNPETRDFTGMKVQNNCRQIRG